MFEQPYLDAFWHVSAGRSVDSMGCPRRVSWAERREFLQAHGLWDSDRVRRQYQFFFDVLDAAFVAYYQRELASRVPK